MDEFFAEHGYMPALHRTKPKPLTAFIRRTASGDFRDEAQSYDDWCTAQIARSLATRPTTSFFLNAPAITKISFSGQRPTSGPRTPTQWIEPFDPGWSVARAGAITPRKTTATRMIWDGAADLPACSS